MYLNRGQESRREVSSGVKGWIMYRDEDIYRMRLRWRWADG